MTTSIDEWIFGNYQFVGLVVLNAILAFAFVTICMRLVGLRSFSKMSSTDFVTTVALGSLMAGIISAPSPSLFIGIIALASLFGLKFGAAIVRRHWPPATKLLDNQPRYLMRGHTISQANLAAARMTVPELHSKLRQANVWNYGQVVCVVLETTGDVSVIHKTLEDAPISDDIFSDVSTEQ